MNKLSGIGVISIVLGMTLLILNALAKLMGKSFSFVDMNIDKLISPDGASMASDMSPGIIHNMLSPVLNAPIYILCIVFGLILLIAGGIKLK